MIDNFAVLFSFGILKSLQKLRNLMVGEILHHILVKKGDFGGDFVDRDDGGDAPGDIFFVDPLTGILLNSWLPAVALWPLVARTLVALEGH